MKRFRSTRDLILSFCRWLAIGALGLCAAARAQPVESTQGRFTYPGREDGAAWREEALARIDLIRKGDFAISVVDPSGAPVPGASVQVEETRSAFTWGTAVPLARIVGDTPDDRRFRQVLLEFFNEVSSENDLKWPMWEGDLGPQYNHEQSLAALRWLRAHGFYIRGHNLVWPGKPPNWRDLPESVKRLRGTPRQGEIPALALAHIRDITAATRGFIDEWDVINEPFDHHVLMDLFGRHIMVDWFRAAHEGAPGALLFLNDWGNEDLIADPAHCRNTFETVAYLQRSGAPIGGLGLQCHINRKPTPPENFLGALDLYAALRIPIRITEFDFNTSDERLQADYTRDFLIAAFSHPSVIGVQLWGFWEKAHWRPAGAMFRADWSEKPNAKVYRSLVLGKWRTRLAETTGGDGAVRARGFYGEYRAVVTARGRTVDRTFSLRPGEAPPTIAIAVP